MKVTYQSKDFSVAVKTRGEQDHLVLFLHGLGCAKECFHNAFEDVWLKPFSIATCDFVGFGSSSKPADFAYRLEDQAEIINRVIEILKPVKISIVAHSMGGAIGLLVAEKCKNLEWYISIEGNLVGEDCGLVSRGIANQSAEQFGKKGYEEFLAKLEVSDRSDFKEWGKWYRQALPQALHASAQSLVEWSDCGKLLQIFNNLPRKGYVCGDEDSKDYLIPKLQNAQVILLPNAGHFCMVDNPKSLYANVANILRQD